MAKSIHLRPNITRPERPVRTRETQSQRPLEQPVSRDSSSHAATTSNVDEQVKNYSYRETQA